MSAPSSVVVPTKGGEVQPGDAAAATKMSGGGLVLSPLPLNGGKRKSRKVSKKVLKMLKKMSRKQLKKLMKGGEVVGTDSSVETTPSTETTGAGKKKTRKNKKSRKHSMLY